MPNYLCESCVKSFAGECDLGHEYWQIHCPDYIREDDDSNPYSDIVSKNTDEDEYGHNTSWNW